MRTHATPSALPSPPLPSLYRARTHTHNDDGDGLKDGWSCAIASWQNYRNTSCPIAALCHPDSVPACQLLLLLRLQQSCHCVAVPCNHVHLHAPHRCHRISRRPPPTVACCVARCWCAMRRRSSSDNRHQSPHSDATRMSQRNDSIAYHRVQDAGQDWVSLWWWWHLPLPLQLHLLVDSPPLLLLLAVPATWALVCSYAAAVAMCRHYRSQSRSHFSDDSVICVWHAPPTRHADSP